MYSFVARQPIFDRELNVFAYELLFRSSLENVFPAGMDGDQATARIIIDHFIANNIHSITEGKKAFINFTEGLLMQEAVYFLPPKDVVVEILESVLEHEDCIKCCEKMRASGYKIALDDIINLEQKPRLSRMADIIKIDFSLTTPEDRITLVSELGRPDVHFLAEKLETREQFEEALHQGFSYFQGYFFCKPQVLQRRCIPESKLNKLDLLRVINQTDPDFKAISEIIKRDVAMTYKLLRLINSAHYGLNREIESIHQAIVYMGLGPLRKWVSFLALIELGDDKPNELLVNTLFRARFCELIAMESSLSANADDLFLVGMFSRIDALMDRPLKTILQEISLTPLIKSTLLGERTSIYPIYQMVEAYEKGYWKAIDTLCRSVDIDKDTLPQRYNEALAWAKNALMFNQATL